MSKRIEDKIVKWYKDIVKWYNGPLNDMFEQSAELAKAAKDNNDFLLLQGFHRMVVDMSNKGMQPYIDNMKKQMQGESYETRLADQKLDE